MTCTCISQKSEAMTEQETNSENSEYPPSPYLASASTKERMWTSPVTTSLWWETPQWKHKQGCIWRRNWGKDSTVWLSWAENGAQEMGKGRTDTYALKRCTWLIKIRIFQVQIWNLRFHEKQSKPVTARQSNMTEATPGRGAGTSDFVIPCQPEATSPLGQKYAWEAIIYHQRTFQEERYTLFLPDLPFSKKTTTN